jgi:hypothetical protein
MERQMNQFVKKWLGAPEGCIRDDKKNGGHYTLQGMGYGEEEEKKWVNESKGSKLEHHNIWHNGGKPQSISTKKCL